MEDKYGRSNVQLVSNWQSTCESQDVIMCHPSALTSNTYDTSLCYSYSSTALADVDFDGAQDDDEEMDDGDTCDFDS